MVQKDKGLVLVSCHSYGAPQVREKIITRIKVQGPGVPLEERIGSCERDYSTTPDNRPHMELLHINGMRIHCPRPSTISLTVAGQVTQEPSESMTHLGLCSVCVTSHFKPEPGFKTEGETTFYYKGGLLPHGLTTSQIRDSGKFLLLTETQVKLLAHENKLFDYTVEFGLKVTKKRETPLSNAGLKLDKDTAIVTKIVLPWRSKEFPLRMQEQATTTPKPVAMSFPIYDNHVVVKDTIVDSVLRAHAAIHN